MVLQILIKQGINMVDIFLEKVDLLMDEEVDQHA